MKDLMCFPRSSPQEFRRRSSCAAVVLLQAFLLLCPLSAGLSHLHDRTLADATSKRTLEKVYADGFCSMYGICSKRTDGKVLNCPNATRSVKPDKLLSEKIQSLCPTLTGNVCCSADQFNTLRGQVQQAIPFLVGCPACLRNFLNLFCELSCSPSQSLFINVTSTKEVNSTLTVDGIDFYVSTAYGEELYNSCKDVKFGTMNTRAMDFIGGGAKNYEEWFTFIGRQAGLNEPGSPYAINFRSIVPEVSATRPMNVTVHSCGDSSLGCSCGDCPSPPVCSASPAPTVHEKRSCHVKIGSSKVNCIDFALFIVYIILVPSFMVLWGLLHRRKKQAGLTTRTKPLMNDKGEKEVIHKQDDNSIQHSTKGETPEARILKPSVVQGYISSFFRMYGAFISRHPTLDLCLSLALPLLLCIGLVHFEVETRPQKLWVGPGSTAAEKKQFFDSHLTPFLQD